MGWAAVFQAIAKGLVNAFSTWSYLKETKEQSKEFARQAQEQADERAKRAKYQMQQQKTSFLKGGVYFDSGTPLEVINETYNTMSEDISAINRDSLTQQNKLKRAGQTAFFTFLIDPAGDNGNGQTANSIYQGFQSQSASKNSAAKTNTTSSSTTSNTQIFNNNKTIK